MKKGDVWRLYAACKDYPTKMFFPDYGANNVSAVKKICEACPVKRPCLEEALTYVHDSDGIRGGTTETERRELRKQRRYG